MRLTRDNRGVSLPLVIGLTMLLVLITTTLNELVIRALRSAHQIEASDRAYFAAEAGIEDALYELSAHSAGYETQASLGEADVRSDDFTQNVLWANEWEIKNKGLNDCAQMDDWEAGFLPGYCGRLFGGQKLIINLFADDALSVGVGTSAVNETVADIGTLSVSNFVLKLRLPKEVVLDNGLTTLRIDNDRDLGSSSESGPEAILGLNEDGPEMYSYPQNSCDYSKGRNVDDDDCDGKEDEDSQHDPVVLWKMIDDTGRSFQPLRGCKTYGTPHPSHNDTNSSLCEMDFVNAGNGELSVTLSGLADKGYDNEDPIGVYSTLQDFLGSYSIADSRKLQMELLIVAPMEAIDADGKRVPIPYYEYGLSYNAGGDIIPSTFFSIKSDGYYRDFKQSITTNVVPRETTRLLDLTIIQQ